MISAIQAFSPAVGVSGNSGTDGQAARILIVDDQDVNRQLLEELLRPEGHVLISCADGEEALRHVRGGDVDLVLLDITMPGMDGLEVCRRIRANPDSASLPVIMVTALAHRQQQLDGIAAGASDYLTKPIDSVNLLLRVRNAVHVRRLHRNLQSQYRQLRELETLRDSLVHMLVHDLRSPLQSLIMMLELTRESAGDHGDAQLLEDLDSMQGSAEFMAQMISNVLDVNRFEAGAMPLHMERIDLVQVTREAVATVGVRQTVRISIVPETERMPVEADAGVVRRVIANLVANACKFSPDGSEVRLLLGARADACEVRVIDAGPGISPEHHGMIFEKFGQVHGGGATSGRSSGLGLAFCRLGVEAIGGRIGVESAPGHGATFWFTVPTSAGVASHRSRGA